VKRALYWLIKLTALNSIDLTTDKIKEKTFRVMDMPPIT
jgi:hypothetical protein